jgi:hypothetical protein
MVLVVKYALNCLKTSLGLTTRAGQRRDVSFATQLVQDEQPAKGIR